MDYKLYWSGESAKINYYKQSKLRTVKFNVIFVLLLFVFNSSYSQTNAIVQPKGIYSEIKITDQNKMIQLLIDPKTREAAVDTIFQHINHYNPVVLYVFAQVLFIQGEKQSGVEWYLFAQINALYDANRCSDVTAKEATKILESKFRPAIEEYIRANKQEYLKSVNKVVSLFREISQDYDYRWINLHGMDAINASLGNDDGVKKEITLTKESWSNIKETTINFFQDYNKKSIQ